MICDRPLDATSAGKYSVELKLRRVCSDGFRVKLRNDLRAAALDMFQAVVQRSKGQWAGRVLLLVEFCRGAPTHWTAVRGDWYLQATEEWKGMFGWLGARRPSLAAPRSLPQPASQPASSRPPQQLLRRCDAAIRSITSSGQIKVNSKPMWSINAFLQQVGTPAAKRALPTIGERLPRWKKRKGWADDELGQQPRKRGKPGGSPAHQATEQVLRDIFNMFA